MTPEQRSIQIKIFHKAFEYYGIDLPAQVSTRVALKAIELAQTEAHNKAIKDAVENAEVEWYGKEGDENCRVNKDSILKLLK